MATSNTPSIMEEKERSWESFQSWLRGPGSSDVYWVKGKAGSGKSTLMKHLEDADNRSDPHWISEDETTVNASGLGGAFESRDNPTSLIDWHGILQNRDNTSSLKLQLEQQLTQEGGIDRIAPIRKASILFAAFQAAEENLSLPSFSSADEENMFGIQTDTESTTVEGRRSKGITEASLFRVNSKAVLDASKDDAGRIAYSPLHEINNEFRLLRLKSRSLSNQQSFPQIKVFCELEQLVQRNDVEYTALSYVWGSAVEKRPIFLGGRILEINANLEEALCELRDGSDDTLVWVDQICINQEDDLEKRHQIQRMGNIYSDAVRVVAWLGPAADDSDLVMSGLAMMGKLDDRECPQMKVEDLRPLLLPAAAKAFHQFCQRPYWKRLWIIQEFSLAKEVHLACGSAVLPFRQFKQAFDFVAFLEQVLLAHLQGNFVGPALFLEMASRIVKAYGQSFARSFVQGVMTRRIRYQQQDGDRDCLFRVLVTTLVLERDYNHPECSDPRDRIFSVLGLASDAGFFKAFPDYAKSCEDIYEEAARQFLRQGHIDTLSYCQFPRNSRNRKMASWAPDWFMETRMPCTNSPWYTSCSASRDSLPQQHITFPDPARVVLRGVYVDRVEEFGNTWNPDWLKILDTVDVLRYLEKIKQFCEKSARIPTADVDSSTARIAVADRVYPDNGRPDQRRREQLCLAGYRHFVNQIRDLLRRDHSNQMQGQTEDSSDLEPWYTQGMKDLHSRRPFISRCGFVGLAPDNVEVGDLICIFLGGRTPYMLRPEPASPDVFTLVGETYVHGTMYGEYMKETPYTLQSFILV